MGGTKWGLPNPAPPPPPPLQQWPSPPSSAPPEYPLCVRIGVVGGAAPGWGGKGCSGPCPSVCPSVRLSPPFPAPSAPLRSVDVVVDAGGVGRRGFGLLLLAGAEPWGAAHQPQVGLLLLGLTGLRVVCTWGGGGKGRRWGGWRWGALEWRWGALGRRWASRTPPKQQGSPPSPIHTQENVPQNVPPPTPGRWVIRCPSRYSWDFLRWVWITMVCPSIPSQEMPGTPRLPPSRPPQRGLCRRMCSPPPPPPSSRHSLAFEEAESEGEMSEEPSHCSRLMMAWLSATSKLSFSTLPSASGRDLGRGVTRVPRPQDGGLGGEGTGTEPAVLHPSTRGRRQGLDAAPWDPAGLHIPIPALHASPRRCPRPHPHPHLGPRCPVQPPSLRSHWVAELCPHPHTRTVTPGLFGPPHVCVLTYAEGPRR